MNVESLVKQVETLFTLPEVALRVIELLNAPEPSNIELEEIISSDPALTAKILKIVNSAYFGFPGTVDSVSRAITIVGLNELRNLVITTSVTTSFKGIPSELVDMDVFWYHSVTSGLVAKIMAKKLKCFAYEGLYIAGLLHSVGRLIYFSQCPDESKQILAVKDQGEEAMVEAEKRIFGFTYAELSAELLRQWKIPPTIWQVIYQHLEPLKTVEFKQETCVLHVASKIAASVEPCAKYDFDFKDIEPIFTPGTLEQLKITPNQMQFCIDEAMMQAFEVLAIINPRATTIY